MCLRSDPLHKVMERLANPGSYSFFYLFLSMFNHFINDYFN